MTASEISPEEHLPYYKVYIDKAPKLDLIEALESSHTEFLDFLSIIPEDKLNYRYAEGKWTIKEILLHLIDAEKVFNYRAMRFTRDDKTPLPGYDHDAYVNPSGANNRSMGSLIEEYRTQRESTIVFFKNLTDDMLKKQGIASDNNLSVRAIGFIQCGHALHHMGVMEEKYL